MTHNTFDMLIKYYEVHVTHRRHMFHFFIIASGLMVTAIGYTSEKSFFITASVFAFLGALSALAYRALDKVTYLKIRRSEGLITTESSIDQDTAEDLFQRNTGIGDNTITTSITYLVFTLFGWIFILTSLSIPPEALQSASAAAHLGLTYPLLGDNAFVIFTVLGGLFFSAFVYIEAAK